MAPTLDSFLILYQEGSSYPPEGRLPQACRAVSSRDPQVQGKQGHGCIYSYFYPYVFVLVFEL